MTRLVDAFAATSAELRDGEPAAWRRASRSARGTSRRRPTSSKLANAELARANQELRQLDRMKTEFVSLVSHQLRAPLTNINGALEIVSADATALPPASQRTLQILTQESQRLSRLIQRILDVSRLEAGRLPLHLGPVALEPLLARAAESTLGVAGETPWRLEVPSGLPPAWADEQLLGEVVRNLLENAVRYAPPGGPVVVDVVARDDDLEIGVTDEGPGVPAEEQARIFGSFHRLGDVDTRDRGLRPRALLCRPTDARAARPDRRRESAAARDREPGSRFWVRLPIAGGGPDENDDAPWPDDPTVMVSDGPADGAHRAGR